MSERLSHLLCQSQAMLVQCWADEIYRDATVNLATRLSYEQLVAPLPTLLDTLAVLINENSDNQLSKNEIINAAEKNSRYVHVRFQQGCLIDELARELSVLRRTVNGFLWRSSTNFDGSIENMHELQVALDVTNAFIDEVLRQMIVVYAVNLRPPVQTFASIWRRRSS